MWIYRESEGIPVNLDKVERMNFDYDETRKDTPWGMKFELPGPRWVRYDFETEEKRTKYFKAVMDKVGCIIVDERDPLTL